jgi:guanine deaminase
MTTSYTIYYGTIVHSLSLQELEVLLNTVLVVDNTTGLIAHVEKDVEDLEHYLADAQWPDVKVRV